MPRQLPWIIAPFLSHAGTILSCSTHTVAPQVSITSIIECRKKELRREEGPRRESERQAQQAFRLLGDSFLKILHDWDLLKRIDSVRVSGHVPRAAHDTTKFHRVYWKAFQRVCGQPFGELARAQQTTALRNFLWQKFSTDPSGRAMVPPKGRRRKKLSWAGFWLTEEEVMQISEAVIAAYHMHRDGAAFHIQRERGQTR